MALAATGASAPGGARTREVNTMFTTRLGLLLLVLAAFPSLSVRVSLPGQSAPNCKLCGTWLLVDRSDRTFDGTIVEESSLGADPFGILLYDSAGNVAAQLMKRDRSRKSTTPPPVQSQGDNNSAAVNGYDAYFGKFVVDENKHTVTHYIEAAIAPADVGKLLTRRFQLVGEELRISFDTTNNGVPVRRTLRWKRAT